MQAFVRLIPSVLMLFWCVLILHLIAACASNPYDQDSYQSFMRNSLIETAQFKHRLEYIEPPANTYKADSPKQARKLSIFIEGDGSPWFREQYVAKDPSPTRLLMYDAMQDVQGSKLYLGRPCYFQTNDPKCHYRYWTSHRYSSDVVRSMRDVLEKYIQGYEEIVYIGHSGGGTLAALLACAPTTDGKSRTLITLSANLDTDNWTDHHGWTRMHGSLNPARTLMRCPEVKQYHYVGQEDDNVPAALNQHYFELHSISPILYEEAGHTDWLLFWPDIIRNNPALKSSAPP